MDFDSLTVLVIDDNVHTVRLVSGILREFGAEKIVTANDGHEGLTEVDNHGDTIDLIICDLEMPNLKGSEFIRRLRGGDTPKIPVLVITGHSDNAHMIDAIGAGINGILVKPLKPGPLISRVKSSLASDYISLTKK